MIRSKRSFSIAVACAALTAFGWSASIPLAFRDVAAPAGIHASMHCGSAAKNWIPEANGSGAAWLDYDNDGLMDLLIVNGGSMDQLRQVLAGNTPAPVHDGVYLYRNLGGGRFQDVTAQSGLANPYWGTGANAADFNGDGYADILITTIGRDLLFKNNGNGTFTDVSQSTGLSQSPAWHTGSAFGDFDGDGKLDLFIASYIDLHAVSWNDPAPVCNNFGQRSFCGPIGLKGGQSVLYHNNGNGSFSDITKTSGIASVPPAHGFTPVTGDFNSDGKLDIFVANDSDPNYLFLNQGDGTFKEQALDRGMAFNAEGKTQSNMGVAVGEYGPGSARTDVLITTFNHDYFPLFRQGKSGIFDEIASTAGLEAVTGNYLGWACGLADFTNSGARDFWTANGHVYPTDPSYFEPITIFRSEGSKSRLIFSYPIKPDHSYRGGAVADYDNNGSLDLLVLPISGAPVLLENETAAQGAWIGLTLRGTQANRDAIGAKVSVQACGVTQSDEVRSGGSYLSRNDPRLHFGFGSCQKLDRLTVTWPDGIAQTSVDLALNHYLTIQYQARK